MQKGFRKTATEDIKGFGANFWFELDQTYALGIDHTASTAFPIAGAPNTHPIEAMVEGGIPAMLEIRRYVDFGVGPPAATDHTKSSENRAADPGSSHLPANAVSGSVPKSFIQVFGFRTCRAEWIIRWTKDRLLMTFFAVSSDLVK
jgi:hypothetical protein